MDGKPRLLFPLPLSWLLGKGAGKFLLKVEIADGLRAAVWSDSLRERPGSLLSANFLRKAGDNGFRKFAERLLLAGQLSSASSSAVAFAGWRKLF